MKFDLFTSIYVNIYTYSGNRHEISVLNVFHCRRPVKSLIFFLKNSLKNVLGQTFEIVWLGVVIKFNSSECNTIATCADSESSDISTVTVASV